RFRRPFRRGVARRGALAPGSEGAAREGAAIAWRRVSRSSRGAGAACREGRRSLRPQAAWGTNVDPYGPRHRRRLPRARREPVRPRRAGGDPVSAAHEGRRSAREVEEQAGGHEPPRDRGRQGALQPPERRRGGRVHQAAAGALPGPLSRPAAAGAARSEGPRARGAGSAGAPSGRAQAAPDGARAQAGGSQTASDGGARASGRSAPGGESVPQAAARRRRRRDLELEAGTSAHYEDPAYYEATYRRRAE